MGMVFMTGETEQFIKGITYKMSGLAMVSYTKMIKKYMKDNGIMGRKLS